MTLEEMRHRSSPALAPAVRPVVEDARGIVNPRAGFGRYDLVRHAPSSEVGRFVDRYWVVTWDLDDGRSYAQDVLPHPVANVVFEGHDASLHGVTRRRTTQVLEGSGRVLGVMFRPGGFRPFLGRSMATITDRVLDVADVFGAEVRDLVGELTSAPDGPEMAAAADRFLAGRVPVGRQVSEDVSEIAEHIAKDPTVFRVEELAREHAMSTRHLQRLFAEHVGVSPKWVVRRYRLYEAAERAGRGRDFDWAALAADLGYSDQAHLTREFTAAFGMPPQRYARYCTTTAPDPS